MTSQHEPLKSPTLIEVVFELRFHSNLVTQVYLDEFSQYFYERYPVRTTIENKILSFSIGSDAGDPQIGFEDQSQNPDLIEFRFSDNKARNFIQIGKGIITINSLDYTGFHNFLNELINVINYHNHVTKTISYKRVGLRYINHITIGNPLDIFKWLAPLPSFSSENGKFSVVANTQNIVINTEDGLQSIVVAYPQVNQIAENVMLLDIEQFIGEDRFSSPDPKELVKWAVKAHDSIWDAYVNALTPEFLEKRKNEY